MDIKAQKLFSAYISGDSIIQLTNGKLIFYNFNKFFNYIYIYDGNTFHQLFKIFIHEIIFKFEIIKNKDNIEAQGDDENLEDKLDYLNITNIKELKDGKILIGHNKYLFELNIYKKSYSCEIVKKMDVNILDINEISNNRLIIIASIKILILKKENLEYIIINEYQINNNWKIIPMSETHRYYGDFRQYFFSYVLPNNKLLLNSFSTELRYNGWCGTHPPTEFSNSKIIFIDLDNFEEISSTETFKIDAKYIIFENIVVIQIYKKLIIYDINSLKIINEIKLKK